MHQTNGKDLIAIVSGIAVPNVGQLIQDDECAYGKGNAGGKLHDDQGVTEAGPLSPTRNTLEHFNRCEP